MTERVTLITGASAGIGTEFARLFAANGHRVALTARRADRLEAIAGEIASAGRRSPILIPCDLQNSDAGDKIEAALKAADVEVEYLRNHAGFGLFGRAIELDRPEQLHMIDLNVRALADLTLRFAPSVVRCRGGILNVASIASFLPGPGMAMYYASKAFVLSFTEAMREELKPHGVRVTALCPGPVPTEFQQRAGFKPQLNSAALDVSASEVARQGYQGLMANRRAVLPGLGIKLLPLMLRLVPRSFLLTAVGKSQLRRTYIPFWPTSRRGRDALCARAHTMLTPV